MFYALRYCEIDMDAVHKKLKQLKDQVQEYGSAAVAFSGGVDSTFLLKVCHDVLGDKCVAITVRSFMFSKREIVDASSFCEMEGIRQLNVDTDESFINAFSDNPPNRCYICKRALFELMIRAAKTEGISVLCEGSNVDDLGDYRPGLKAISELGIKSPLRDCGLVKSEIRALSSELGLATANKPSFACLASRFPYGQKITAKSLNLVERAEDFLRDSGFGQARVRIHGDMARIEVDPNAFTMAVEMCSRIVEAFKSFGFSYVALDLQGYRTGSMNEPLLVK